tara:strand:- start:334 stop:702 length:369 start_codon:yes stop_codon:yes gene_type:complete
MEKISYWLMPDLVRDKEKGRQVVKLVCKHFDISHNELRSKSRLRNIVDVRGVITYILVNHHNFTLSRAGSLVGKDHSLVIHYNKKTRNLMDVDKIFKGVVDGLAKKTLSYNTRTGIKSTIKG